MTSEGFWYGYEPYDPGSIGLLSELPRAEARLAYERLMHARPERESQLSTLLAGCGMRLERTDAGVQQLNDWFRSEVKAAEGGRLRPEWYSVVNDIALFLGDTIIERDAGLRWEFYIRGRKNVSYQRHVIMGFTRVPNPGYCVDIDRVVAVYGHRVVANQPVDGAAFVKSLAAAHERA